jgi:hypothetical protein
VELNGHPSLKTKPQLRAFWKRDLIPLNSWYLFKGIMIYQGCTQVLNLADQDDLDGALAVSLLQAGQSPMLPSPQMALKEQFDSLVTALIG